MSKKVVTLYLSVEPYKTLKKVAPALGKSVSELVDGWIKEGLKELTGEEFKAKEIDYAALKKVHNKLVGEVERLERWLKRRKVLEDLENLVRELGIKTSDLSNLNIIAPKVLEEWKKDSGHIAEDAHSFITYLEVIKEKKEVERRLTLFRQEPDTPAVQSMPKETPNHTREGLDVDEEDEDLEEEEDEEEEWEEEEDY